MALNIKATRRYGLGSFGIGWEDCFLTVTTLNRDEQRDLTGKMTELERSDDVAGLDTLLRDFFNTHVTGGRIINTHDDGSSAPYDFDQSETSSVSEFFTFPFLLEVMETASGADRLKLKSI